MVDQPVEGNHLIGGEKQDGQHRPLFRSGDVDRPLVLEHFQRSQGLELQQGALRARE